jgi:hypothetical protein
LVSFEVEAQDILRELLREPGALAASLGAPPPALDVHGSVEKRVPLLHGAELVVAVAETAPPSLDATVEHAARDLMTRLRLYQVTDVPSIWLAGATPRSREALLRRVQRLLEALSSMHGAVAVALGYRTDVLAAAGDLDEQRRDRLPFLRRRIDAEAARRRGKTSHAEIVGEDVYARSFWFDAYLWVFFGGEGWPEDFVRHRARQVIRQLSAILPYLIDGPPASAQVKPVPTPP